MCAASEHVQWLDVCNNKVIDPERNSVDNNGLFGRKLIFYPVNDFGILWKIESIQTIFVPIIVS